MNRSIFANMEKYPNRMSYLENNLLRELASPIREDAHSKKMSGRSVVVEWDVRYITDSTHDYAEIVYELPTALTCDALPEEAVLNRNHRNYSSFFKNVGTEIKGVDLVPTDGKLDISFSNTTDSDREVSISFANSNGYKWRVSYFMDEPLFLYEKRKLWPTIGYNGKHNRVKTGVVLVGTTV
jgi:hypothetical protein